MYLTAIVAIRWILPVPVEFTATICPQMRSLPSRLACISPPSWPSAGSCQYGRVHGHDLPPNAIAPTPAGVYSHPIMAIRWILPVPVEFTAAICPQPQALPPRLARILTAIVAIP